MATVDEQRAAAEWLKNSPDRPAVVFWLSVMKSAMIELQNKAEKERNK